VDTRARGYLKPRVTVKTAKAVKHAAFVEVLREMSLKPGDRVEFHLDKNNRLVITPIDSEWLKTLDEVLGSMTGMWDGFDLRKEREEWDSKYS